MQTYCIQSRCSISFPGSPSVWHHDCMTFDCTPKLWGQMSHNNKAWGSDTWKRG